jgi:ribosomal-protein-alanine N-acetyltransferase
MFELDFKTRPALPADQRQISNLMRFSPHIHHHLDWRYPLDWIGSSPFFVLESQGMVVAALACPPDPPKIAWIRLFVSSGVPLEKSWQALWETTLLDLTDKGRYTVAVIVLNDWFLDLLRASGFLNRQDIVLLESDVRYPAGVFSPPDVSVRPMLQNDIPVVADVDAEAFDPLWQNSLFSLEQAYPQAALATVAEVNGQLIGYQISTRNALGLHLARLAVRPALKGRGVGRALVVDLFQKAVQNGCPRLTVNTQSDNAASLALYKKTGFHETGERFPVYQLQIP